MSSAVAELEAGLQAMLSLKPPGVSGSRISSITNLCTANVQSESVLIQKLYTHFKKAPATHKLGVLYVVDSVTRKWTEQAKVASQPITSTAQDGTFAAGVHRVKELLPVLMNDIVQSAPDDQKEKIKKLIDIWEKGQTFPLQMLTTFKEKLAASMTAQNMSTTPPGSPPSHIQQTLGMQQPSAPAAASTPNNTSSILEALANMARQNNTAPPMPAVPSTSNQDSLYNVSNAQNTQAPLGATLNQPLQFPPFQAPVNVPAAFAPPVQGQGPNSAAQNFASNQSTPFAAAPVVPAAGFQQQLMLIKALADQGFPPDKIAGIIAAMGPGAIPPPPSQFPVQNQTQNAQNAWGSRTEESRDRSGYEAVKSPQGRYRRRSRSPSPSRAWNARDSPAARRRDEPHYEYDRESPGRSRGSRGRGSDYRQRSPPRRGQSPSPPPSYGHGQKWVGHDDSIGRGNIKVLSRTLFVGGVTSSEQELRSIFDRFGTVQTCIVNKEKRHAFVKMVSREDAIAAKDSMEKNRSPDSQLRTRWGVGFGPRDCSDYQTGVSIIPISKLTDADRKWMLNAEYGGSGGKPIEPGMVVEEPDIEIGQGVSSKAISRRMQTDKGGSNGPKSGRDREDDDGPRHRRDRDNRRDSDRNENFNTQTTVPPIVPPFSMPGFPYPTLPNGMPMFPPGFVFPGQTQAAQPQQPPAPGHQS
ncbi:hypothetical protein B7494_g6772 [Chlorociboria aeruginascens]|nr:hypothetical protein B7494_g6772 [Chlorociboria aeruginascens]